MQFLIHSALAIECLEYFSFFSSLCSVPIFSRPCLRTEVLCCWCFHSYLSRIPTNCMTSEVNGNPWVPLRGNDEVLFILCLVVVLPLPQSFANLVIALYAATIIWKLVSRQKLDLDLDRSVLLKLKLLPLLYFVFLFSLLYSDNLPEGLSYIKRTASLLIIPGFVSFIKWTTE